MLRPRSNCPNCQSLLSKTDKSPPTGIAKCSTCDGVFDLYESRVFRPQTIGEPPKGIELLEVGDTLWVTMRLYRLRDWLLQVFTLPLFGIPFLVFCWLLFTFEDFEYYADEISFLIASSLLGLLGFWLCLIGLLTLFHRRFFNANVFLDREFAVNPYRIEVYTYNKIGRKKLIERLNVLELDQFFVAHREGFTGGKFGLLARTRLYDDFVLVNGSWEKEPMDYLEKIIEYYLGIKDQPIKEEL